MCSSCSPSRDESNDYRGVLDFVPIILVAEATKQPIIIVAVATKQPIILCEAPLLPIILGWHHLEPIILKLRRNFLTNLVGKIRPPR